MDFRAVRELRGGDRITVRFINSTASVDQLSLVIDLFNDGTLKYDISLQSRLHDINEDLEWPTNLDGRTVFFTCGDRWDPDHFADAMYGMVEVLVIDRQL